MEALLVIGNLVLLCLWSMHEFEIHRLKKEVRQGRDIDGEVYEEADGFRYVDKRR